MAQLHSLGKVSRSNCVLYSGELLAITLGRLRKRAVSRCEHACQCQRADQFRVLHFVGPFTINLE